MPKYANLQKYAKICQNAKPIIFMPNPLKKCQISGIWHKICQAYHPWHGTSTTQWRAEGGTGGTICSGARSLKEFQQARAPKKKRGTLSDRRKSIVTR